MAAPSAQFGITTSEATPRACSNAFIRPPSTALVAPRKDQSRTAATARPVVPQARRMPAACATSGNTSCSQLTRCTRRPDAHDLDTALVLVRRQHGRRIVIALAAGQHRNGITLPRKVKRQIRKKLAGRRMIRPEEAIAADDAHQAPAPIAAPTR
ncbi:MAG: hypothetical protein FIA96_02295, partial [Betaproteobacteria bacterium]|nr:hypothetical protein [Betaproteobacteria bacterium]